MPISNIETNIIVKIGEKDYDVRANFKSTKSKLEGSDPVCVDISQPQEESGV